MVLPGLALTLLLGAAAPMAGPIELPRVSTEEINDTAKVLEEYDRDKIFSGFWLHVLTMPKIRIVTLPELKGQDPDVVARKLADSWGYPTDWGYLLVVFAKERESSLVINLDASRNGFGMQEWRSIHDEIAPDLAVRRWGNALNRAAVRIMWEDEAARSQVQGSRMGVWFAHIASRRPWMLVPMAIVLIGALLWLFSSARLKYNRARG